MRPQHSLVALAVALALAASAHGDSCPDGTAMWLLTGVSAPSCLATQMGAQWAWVKAVKKTDCSYTVEGSQVDNGNQQGNSMSAYAFPTSPTISYGQGKTWTSTFWDTTRTQTGNTQQQTARNGSMVDVKYPRDFAGLTSVLKVALVPLVRGPFGPTTDQPANYTFALQQGSTMKINQPPTKCTFTYTMVSGVFGDMKPTKDVAQPGSVCPAGAVRKSIEGTGSGTVCAFCTAGTFASGGLCKPCPAGQAAAASGSSSCAACTQGLVPGIGATACVPCITPNNYQYPNGIQQANWYPVNNTVFTGGDKCTPLFCPANTTAAPAPSQPAACYGGSNGDFCQAAPNKDCGAQGGANYRGGAALLLQTVDSSSKACQKPAMASLIKYMRGRSLFIGYDLSGTGDTYNPMASFGLNVALQGLASKGPILAYPICGNAHGGPGSQPALAQAVQLLGKRSYVFSSILNSNTSYSAAAPRPWDNGYNPQGWGAVASPGSAPGTVSVRWFRDTQVGACGLTSLAAPPPAGQCAMTFSVVAGSTLGVAATNKGAACPAGYVQYRQASGAVSCVMCGPGYFAAPGACKPCQGPNYQDEWGAAKCKPCPGKSPMGAYPGPPWNGQGVEANWYCYSSS